jgi:hypothetical protein
MEGALTKLTEIHSRRMELWALCSKCGHAKHFHPSALRGQIRDKIRDGDDTLANVSRLFRCTGCQGKSIILVPYAPEPGEAH